MKLNRNSIFISHITKIAPPIENSVHQSSIKTTMKKFIKNIHHHSSKHHQANAIQIKTTLNLVADFFILGIFSNFFLLLSCFLFFLNIFITCTSTIICLFLFSFLFTFIMISASIAMTWLSFICYSPFCEERSTSRALLCLRALSSWSVREVINSWRNSFLCWTVSFLNEEVYSAASLLESTSAGSRAGPEPRPREQAPRTQP